MESVCQVCVCVGDDCVCMMSLGLGGTGLGILWVFIHLCLPICVRERYVPIHIRTFPLSLKTM